MKKIFFRLGLVLLFFSCAALASGSDVADAAKKEKERRQKITTPSKTFTNKDVEEFKAKNDLGDDSSSEGQPSGDEGEGVSEDYSSSPPEGNGRDETYWRNRYKDATTRVEELQAQSDKLQQAINGQLLNVSNYEGIAAGPQLNAKLGEMKDQLSQVNTDLAAAKQALEDLQDEARKAGADPGWVRE